METVKKHSEYQNTVSEELPDELSKLFARFILSLVTDGEKR